MNTWGDIHLRPYRPADAAPLGRLFQSSIRGLASNDYTPLQIEAWLPVDFDERGFDTRCRRLDTWVAELGGVAAGFSDLDVDGHIDMLFVHPDFARRGVARSLLQHIEALAKARDIRRLYTEASLTARPVFERQGFGVITPETVTRRGVEIPRFRMEKPLTPTG